MKAEPSVIRAFGLFIAVALSACGSTATCKCSEGNACVFVGAEVMPSCRPTCDRSDGGMSCPSGTTCGCGGSCAGCDNCVQVCL